MKKPLLTVHFLLLIQNCFTQATAQDNAKNWSVNAFSQKVFVENRGQFEGKNGVPGSTILFGTNDEGMKVFFTNKGLTYRFDRIEAPANLLAEAGMLHTDAQRKAFEKEAKKITVVPELLQMEWQGANPDVKMVTANKTDDYFNYSIPQGGFFGHIPGYQKLIYKNLYPKIDVEYTFHVKSGIKYNLILHPGADPAQIKMAYSGARSLHLSSGDLLISAQTINLKDHAPSTFYADNGTPIQSEFILDDNNVTFKLEKYDQSRTVIIDPWTTPLGFTGDNRAREIGVDAAGNVYIYGSNNNFKLRKYNSSGVLQWTFDSGWDLNSWFGNFAVDSLGNSYLGKGYKHPGIEDAIQMVNTSGVRVYSSFSTVDSMEYFNLCFSKALPNRVGLMGAHPPGECKVVRIDPTTGVSGNPVQIGIGPGVIGSPEEPRGLCSSANGNFYIVTCNQGLPNALICFNSAFATLYTQKTGLNNIEYWGAPYKGFSQAIPGSRNIIAASCAFAYVTDGRTIKKYNAATPGGFIASATIAGGSPGDNAGIYADLCDNVYAGTGSGVMKFDATLTPVAFAATPGPVYDVDYNYATGQIVACGNDFVVSLTLTSPGCVATPCGIAVSLDLLSFNARKKESNNLIEWSTASEINNDYFNIERSLNGIDFNSIGTVKSAGNSNAIKKYEFVDREVQYSEYTPLIYYRLKQTDLDGQTRVSSIISVQLSDQQNGILNVSSNPVRNSDDFFISYTSPVAQGISIKVFNAFGAEVRSCNTWLSEGTTQCPVNIKNLSKGVYYIHATTNEKSETIKIIIQ